MPIRGGEWVPPTNRDRASWAHEGLQTYATRTGVISEDLETQMSDLLGDMMHLARFEGVDFDEVIRRGGGHFRVEVREDPDIFPGGGRSFRGRKDWDPRRG